MGEVLPELSPPPGHGCHPRTWSEDPRRRTLPTFNRCGAMRSYSTYILASTLPGVAPVPRLDALGTVDSPRMTVGCAARWGSNSATHVILGLVLACPDHDNALAGWARGLLGGLSGRALSKQFRGWMPRPMADERCNAGHAPARITRCGRIAPRLASTERCRADLDDLRMWCLARDAVSL
jgi:hypothetical protein